jgi:hypothetical protein
MGRKAESGGKKYYYEKYSGHSSLAIHHHEVFMSMKFYMKYLALKFLLRLTLPPSAVLHLQPSKQQRPARHSSGQT